MLGGKAEGPTPDELDILRGYKPGDITTSAYSSKTLPNIVEEILSLRMKLVRVMDDDESALALRAEYRRLATELRFRDQDEAAAEWARQTCGYDGGS